MSADDLLSRDPKKMLEYVRKNKQYLRKGRIVASVLLWIIIIIVIIYRSVIYRTLSSNLKSWGASSKSVMSGTLGANYLLIVLIIATIGVAFVPFLIRWVSRPKPVIYHWDNFVAPITYKHVDGSFDVVDVNFVLLHIINTGRRWLENPELISNFSKHKLRFIERSLYLDAVSLTKEAIQLDDLVLEERVEILDDKEKKEKERAYLLINKGLQEARRIAEGRFIVLGFAFRDGNRFYPASGEFMKRESIALGEGEERYISLSVRGSNLNKRKILKVGTPLMLGAWDRVEFPELMKVIHKS